MYLCEPQVAVVVSDLEVQAEDAGQLAEVRLVVAEQLHQADRQHEQTARL